MSAKRHDGIPGRVLEVLNRNEFVGPFLLEGFVVYLPEFDYGIDSMFYRERDDLLFKVQLKSRWNVDRKYLGRNIWVAVHNGDPRKGYLAPHDWMVRHGQSAHATTASWANGTYHRASMSNTWLPLYEPFEATSLLDGLGPETISGLGSNQAKDWSGGTSA